MSEQKQAARIHLKTLVEKLMEKTPDVIQMEEGVLVQGDISGIQEFIFGVASKGAAKSLKARSYYIQLASEACVKFIEREYPTSKLIYDGGGTFNFWLPSAASLDLSKLQKQVDKAFFYDDIDIVLSQVSLSQGSYAAAWKALKQETQRNKLRKFQSLGLVLFGFDEANYPLTTYQQRRGAFYEAHGQDFEGFFDHFSEQVSKVFLELQNKVEMGQTTRLAKQSEIEVEFFQQNARPILIEKGQQEFQESIVNKLPLWHKQLLKDKAQLIKLIESKPEKVVASEKEDYIPPREGNIIDFSYLAAFAKERTGTEKLGILKMDVDNLGKIFDVKKDSRDHQLPLLSHYFQGFFSQLLEQLRKEGRFSYLKKESGTFQQAEAVFEHNIYPVFTGGDDCFFVGAWDAIFEFAYQVHEAFRLFATALKEKGLLPPPNALPAKLGYPTPDPATLSAGILVVDEHYPVVRFAELAEEALSAAKGRQLHGEMVKDAISIFGEVFSWQEFTTEIYKNKAILTELILEKGESRALLERLKKSHVGLNSLYKRAEQGNITASKAWKLKYFVARTVSKENLPILEKAIINDFYSGMVARFSGNTSSTLKRPEIYPVAARWAELLTRIACTPETSKVEHV